MWWDISTGGMLMARIDVVRSDRGSWLASPPPATPPAISAGRGSNAARAPTALPAPLAAFGGGGGGTRHLGWHTDTVLDRWATEIEASVGAGVPPSYEVSAVHSRFVPACRGQSWQNYSARGTLRGPSIFSVPKSGEYVN